MPFSSVDFHLDLLWPAGALRVCSMWGRWIGLPLRLANVGGWPEPAGAEGSMPAAPAACAAVLLTAAEQKLYKVRLVMSSGLSGAQSMFPALDGTLGDAAGDVCCAVLCCGRQAEQGVQAVRMQVYTRRVWCMYACAGCACQVQGHLPAVPAHGQPAGTAQGYCGCLASSVEQPAPAAAAWEGVRVGWLGRAGRYNPSACRGVTTRLPPRLQMARIPNVYLLQVRRAPSHFLSGTVPRRAEPRIAVMCALAISELAEGCTGSCMGMLGGVGQAAAMSHESSV